MSVIRWCCAGIAGAAAAPLLGCAFLGTVTATAAAAETAPRVAVVVAAWRTSPVYVDPLFRDALPAADAERVAAAVRPDQPAVFVAVMPVTDNDESRGQWEYELYQLYLANGQSKGVYLVTDGQYVEHAEYGYFSSSANVDESAPLADELIATAAAEVAGAEPDPSAVRPVAPYVSNDDGGTSSSGAVVGGLFAGLAIGVVGYWALVWAVGLARLAVGLRFRWSAAAVGPPDSAKASRRSKRTERSTASTTRTRHG